MGTDGERRRIRVGDFGVAGVSASTDLADDQKCGLGARLLLTTEYEIANRSGRGARTMRGATSDASVMVFSGGGPPCSRSGGVSGYRIRTWIAGVAAARGDRAGGDTRGRSVGRLNPFLTGRGGSRRGVNAGAHLRGVAHDDHAVTARHGLDEAVHPSRSLCHCWCARVRALVCRETRCLFRRGRKRTAIAVRCVRETDEVGKNAEIS